MIILYPNNKWWGNDISLKRQVERQMELMGLFPRWGFVATPNGRGTYGYNKHVRKLRMEHWRDRNRMKFLRYCYQEYKEDLYFNKQLF
jgi:hypothetical protein